jgi:hypothetical protein
MVKASLEQFCTTRARTLELVQGLSQEQMDFSPAADEWSIGEILDHLRLNEHVFRTDVAALIDLAKAGKVPQIYRSFAEFNAAPAFIPLWALPFLEVPFTVMHMFIPNSLRESLVQSNLVSIRHPDITTPRQGRSADALRAELRASLQETEALFAANPTLDYDTMTRQHPLLGIQTVPQFLDLLVIEERLHQDQIVKLIDMGNRAQSRTHNPHNNPSGGGWTGRSAGGWQPYGLPTTPPYRVVCTKCGHVNLLWYLPPDDKDLPDCENPNPNVPPHRLGVARSR